MSVFEIFVDGMNTRSYNDAMDVQAIYLFKHGWTIHDIDVLWAEMLCLYYDDDMIIDKLIDLRHTADAEFGFPNYFAHCPRQQEVFDVEDSIYVRFSWDERNILMDFRQQYGDCTFDGVHCELCEFVGDEPAFLAHGILQHQGEIECLAMKKFDVRNVGI